MIHQTAVIGSGAKIGANVEIGPHSVIGGAGYHRGRLRDRR
jgi:acyl-[acyl carrier protein]--UDP-N-acetylglucosamine O-acyltransferase